MSCEGAINLKEKVSKELQYRPAIDGMRALAVLSVILFHLEPGWLPGGFAGVDVFFVISGYLITSIIRRQSEAGRFSFGEFYQRRVARIFPAFFCVALSTVVAAYFIYTPQDFGSAGANLLAAAASVANLKYMLQGSYFEISPDAQPFLHYWSLAVEEQFYLLFPACYALVFRWRRGWLKWGMWVVMVLSFAGCVVLTQVRPVWAFYLLPTRAWELLAGCLLAVSGAGSAGAGWRPWVRVMGLAMVAGSFCFLREGQGFPGWVAGVPVAGAVLLLGPAGVGDPVERWLSGGLLTAVGRASYSLYLWHWPVFSLVDYRFFGAAGWVRLVVKVVVSVVLAVLSYRYLEGPARKVLNRAGLRGLAFGASAVLIGVSVVLGRAIREDGYVNASGARIAAGGIVYEREPNAGTVMIAGDSNASMYARTLRDLSAEEGRRFVCCSVAAGDPLPGAGDGERLWRDVVAVAAKEKPEVLFVVCHWTGKLTGRRERLKAAVEELGKHAKRIVLCTQPPQLPTQATREGMRRGERPPFFEDEAMRVEREEMNGYVESLAGEGVRVMDVEPVLRMGDGSVRFFDESGRQVYADGSHLSAYGAGLLGGAFRAAMVEAGR